MKGTEEEEINRLVEMTPPLPEDFKSWCENQMKRPLIYYRRKGKEAEIKCAACGKTLYAKTADMRYIKYSYDKESQRVGTDFTKVEPA